MIKGRELITPLMIIDWILYVAASIHITIQSLINGWPAYVPVVIWIQFALMTYFTVSKRNFRRSQPIIFCTFVSSAIFLAGLNQISYYSAFVLYLGSLMMAGLFYKWRLVIYQLVVDIVGIIIQCIVFGTFRADDRGEAFEFSQNIITFIGVALVLAFFIYTISKSEKNFKEAAEEAKSAERSKTEFLANMSHEIRTPMNAIIGMCELALREPDIPEGVKEFCHNIQNSGRSLLSIINDILDFSKIENGRVDLVEEEFNIASTINDVINMANVRMGDKRLELLIDVDPDIPRGLLGDELRIRQIFINILTNAIKYSESGIIWVDITQKKRAYGINLMIKVRDTGIGITEENLDKLFTSFEKLDTKKNRSVEGTGLGLVITKRLLAAMGGFITVESEYGKGSEFRFVIPLKVSDSLPFISIENEENFNALCYVDLGKFTDPRVKEGYTRYLKNIGQKLHIRYIFARSFEKVKQTLEAGGVTHLFVGREEYLENMRFYEEQAGKVEVTIIQSRRNAVPVPATMKCLYKPFYALPLKAVIDNESIMTLQNSETVSTVSFIAPRARVLVVDDNIINLQVAVGLMQPYKMQVLTAESAEEAIRLLGSKDYDLVFMDHMMPDMDGVEATQYLRGLEHEYYKKVPIVALTANAVGGAREMFLANGFNGFLAKPIELSALDKILKQNLPANLIEKKLADDAGEQSQAAEIKEIITAPEIDERIDVKTGLSYAGGSNEAYLAILKTFVTKGAEKAALLNELCKAEDYKRYIIEVHALKSSALSVGAKELSENAKELELSGKSGNTGIIIEKNDSLVKEYKEVLRLGSTLIEMNTNSIEEAAVAEEVSLDDEQFNLIVDKLKSAGELFDADEISNIAKDNAGTSYRGTKLEGYLRRMCEYANDFEFEKAANEIEIMVHEIMEGGAADV